MRLIDANALSKSVLEWLPSDPCGREELEHPFETDICVSMLQEIEEAPTIDAVPVVRCKDCKWHLNGHLCKQLSQYGSIETPPSFYCGYGERREP